MFNFSSTTPINQNRTTSSLLFGNTTTQPSTLTSTPFSSTSVFGANAATPSTTTLVTSSNGTAGQKFNPVEGSEKVTKNGSQTQIRTKHFNICAMPFYEKKSMEELRLEDYAENRKFPSNTNSTSLFGTPTASATMTATSTPIFGGLTTSATTTNLFGTSTTTTTPTPSLTSSAFGIQPTPTTMATATPSLFSGFGTATSTATTSAPSTSLFTFGSTQPAALTTTATNTAPTFNFGGTATSNAGTSFGFNLPKPTTTAPTFSFTPATTTTSAAPTLSLFSAGPTATSTAPTLATAATPMIFSGQSSSVDTRTHLQLFQTMLNIQPFNSEMNFLAKNIKPNIGLDRTRLRTAPDTSASHPLNNIFSPLLTKPSVLTASTSTPPTTNSLPNQSQTLPSVLLSSTNGSIGFLGKRKLADSFLDDDDEHFLTMDDGPTQSMTKLPKNPTNKRPRVLDMNKIRSVVLGGQPSLDLSRKIDENPSETFVVKSTSDQMNGWKKFANYESYLASKKPSIELKTKVDDVPIPIKIDQHRAFRLPRLTHDDYYTEPRIDDLRAFFNQHGQCFVKEFTVGRDHYGSVTFIGSKINLAGLDLDRLVEIDRRQVTVYPDDQDKPAEGEDLNCRAIISLLGVYPIDRSSSTGREEVTDPERLIQMDYGNYLREMTRKFQGQFIDYDVYTGTWKFQVEHF